ncbi:FMN-linked oxidoreductase [Guyanagaster necrorhizus]|uniref:FMN-linked oxidoreductase n=1 Tax=Guyanagaster necrorhizus TaxID=856835 RepID=A0A9P8AUP6_9AGAR|nr:FMN-linked oxidoreductase [Guyanagaster necrorhizus MCA 3950]KAG7447127.1 FMN-linked oxidoreductase [Guyanagaster necrorhizus MCA 3950]
MSSKLFQPTKVGTMIFQNRVVLAPMTRMRASQANVPHLPIAKDYYAQRAHTPGTFLISEATIIAAKAGGRDYAPGIWSDEQIEVWKQARIHVSPLLFPLLKFNQITDAVHEKGCFIYCQLWALGRSGFPETLDREGFPYVSVSDVPLTGRSRAPRPLTVPEIKEYSGLYAQAALNAVKAGFDGVEINGAQGHLLDQFTRDGPNTRTDEYGGSIENRVKFPLEVIDAVVKAVGAERTAYRITPWSGYQGMAFFFIQVGEKLVSQTKSQHPDLAYLHIMEPRIFGNFDRETVGPDEENDFIRNIWAPKTLIAAGGYNRQTAMEAADKTGDLIAFGRHFVSNVSIHDCGLSARTIERHSTSQTTTQRDILTIPLLMPRSFLM